jgi:hypothetical protein
MKKTILIHYIGVGDLNSKDISEYMNDIIKSMPKDDDVINYFIPTRDETKVECLNSNLSEEEYKQTKEILDKTQKIVDNFICCEHKKIKESDNTIVLSGVPKPPLARVLREGSIHICPNCGSTMSRAGFIGLFGKLLCHNRQCPKSMK